MTTRRAPSYIIPRAFPGITAKEVTDLIANSQVHAYAPGTALCQENASEGTFYMILEGETGERMSLRKLAAMAHVPKDFLYRLDAGTARHVSLESLARLCDTLNCTVKDILILERADGESL